MPQISSRSQHPQDPRFTERSNSPSQNQSSSHPTSHPVVVRQSPSPRDPHTHRDTNRTNGPILQQSNWEEPVFEQSNYNYANSNKLPRDSRHHDTDSYRAYPDYQQPVASSPRRVSNERPNEEYLPPLSATPTHSLEGEGKQNSSQKKHQHNEDSGIAGFTPDDQTHRENQDDVLDR